MFLYKNTEKVIQIYNKIRENLRKINQVFQKKISFQDISLKTPRKEKVQKHCFWFSFEIELPVFQCRTKL